MSGNLPKLTNIIVGSMSSKLINTQSEKADLEKEKTSASGKNSDENNYVDMEDAELSTAIENIEEELSFIQEQMESIEKAINSNAKLKEKYEEEYMTLKSKIEDAQDKLEMASTEEMQRFYQMRLFTLGQSLNLIGTQINAVNGMIETKSETQQTLQRSYKNAYSNYEKAANTLNSRYVSAQNYSAPVSSYAAAAGAFDNTQSTGNQIASTYAAASGTVTGSNVSASILNALKGWEGLRTTAYKCPAGVWTIGYGHTGDVKPGQKISEAEAQRLLVQDLAKFEKEVTSQANSIGLKLTQGQHDSLVSFAYNCGVGALKKSGIMNMLKSGNIDAAASKMKEYCHGGGKKLAGLVSRRNAEASWLYA